MRATLNARQSNLITYRVLVKVIGCAHVSAVLLVAINSDKVFILQAYVIATSRCDSSVSFF